jgi:hypothetical protein
LGFQTTKFMKIVTFHCRKDDLYFFDNVVDRMSNFLNEIRGLKIEVYAEVRSYALFRDKR